MNARLARALVVAGIACAGPFALLFDLVARHLVIEGQPGDVRDFMASHLTPIAWCVVPLPLLGGVGGFVRYPRRHAKALARWGRDASITAAVAHQRADFEALFLSTTMAQIPAVLGDFSVMLGAHVLPALCSTAISATAVLVVGLTGPSRLARSELGHRPRGTG